MAQRSNRGPAAAQANRAALLAAARTLFAEEGPQVPLARIADRAGVGKGSLYRQFGDRTGLILAVFAEHLDELERAVSDPSATVASVTELIARRLVESVGFLGVLVPDTASTAQSLSAQDGRMAVVFGDLLADGRRGGYRDDLTVQELVLAIHMFGSMLYTTPEEDRLEAAEIGWPLIRRSLQ